MDKILFLNDYSEGAHPKILEILTKTNNQSELGYGEDSLSIQAKELIKKEIGNESVDIYFVAGGGVANLVCLSSLLKPFESVIAANTSHINIHEAGAIEATGHKINTINTTDGKIRVADIEKTTKLHEDEHMVMPKVVFISNTTELGTVYKKSELEELSNFCRENNLYLYLDGARLGPALVNKAESDLTLPDIVKLVDVFYIGGTKNGALIGEAIVVANPEIQKNFIRNVKQRGALLAKGRLLGAQFVALFTDGLFFQLARHSNEMAGLLRQGITESGYEFLTDSTTNQIFPILPNKVVESLKDSYGFYVWDKLDGDKSVIRLVTSWATRKESVERFVSDLKTLS